MMRSSKKKSKKKPEFKATFSFKRNIVPPIIGLLVFITALGVLDSQWITAQLYYRVHKSSTSEDQYLRSGYLIDPNVKPEIIIPKIAAKAPVVFGEPGYEKDIQNALRRGVVHYSSTPDPGHNGNSVIFGHSSGQLWDSGNYKFIFTMLSRLKTGDKIILDYRGIRYIYSVTGSKVIEPTDFSVLKQTTGPTLSLITCTPAGSNKHRLVVTADQISPKPGTIIRRPKPARMVKTTVKTTTFTLSWRPITPIF